MKSLLFLMFIFVFCQIKREYVEEATKHIYKTEENNCKLDHLGFILFN